MLGGAGNDVYSSTMPAIRWSRIPAKASTRSFSTAHFRLSANVDALVLQGNADLQGYGNGDAN